MKIIANIISKKAKLISEHKTSQTNLSLRDYVIFRNEHDSNFLNWLFSEPDIKDFNKEYAEAFYSFIDSL